MTVSKRNENKTRMERHLYEVAINLFCEVGYQKSTLIDIASEAGVSTRTLYRYFPTKESILRMFSRENILNLKAFASRLPYDMPLKEKVLQIMLYDHKVMFGLFDPSYVLHSARDESGMNARFEIENVLTSESIYCHLFRQAQMASGVEADDAAMLCASIVMGIYRHCNDIYRFRRKGRFDAASLRTYYEEHIDAIWGSIEATLFNAGRHSRSAPGFEKQLYSL